MIFVVVTGPLCDIIYYSLYRSLNSRSLHQDEIELTLRGCYKYVLQQLCNECHCKCRLHKDDQKPRIPIPTALCTSFDHVLDLLNYTKNSQKFI